MKAMLNKKILKKNFFFKIDGNTVEKSFVLFVYTVGGGIIDGDMDTEVNILQLDVQVWFSLLHNYVF